MAEIRPFRALRYTPKAGEMVDLVCPPYDIISEEERLGLLGQNDHNAIRLELCKEGSDIYEEAAKTLRAWLQEGTLAQDEQPGLYIYEEEFMAHGKPNKIKGLIANVRLEEFEKKVVLPHEETLSGPKEDRLRLMNSTGCNFSSIYCMYRDEDKGIFSQIEELSRREPDQTFTTPDGIKHNVWFVFDDEAIANISAGFAEKQLYIADGHHRYTTMINYRNQLRDEGVVTDGEHPANFGMITMMNLENSGLVVFPTHRVVRDMDGFDAEEFLKGCEAYFRVEETQPSVVEGEIITLGKNDKIAFALYHGGKSWVLELTDENIMKELLPGLSHAYQTLDVSILHTLLLERLLGIDKENLANQKNLFYVREAGDAMNAVDKGEGNCAFLINATSVLQIAEISDADEKMPQKSTYFYPKLITGHVMNVVNPSMLG